MEDGSGKPNGEVHPKRPRKPGKQALPSFAARHIAIDEAQAERLAGRGMTDVEICQVLGISQDSLYRRRKNDPTVAEAIKRGRAQAREIVSNKLWSLVEQGHLGAIIWWDKTRGGMGGGLEIKLPKVVPYIRQSLLLAFTSKPRE